MKYLVFFILLSFASAPFAADLKWNCGKLDLKFIEVPGSSGTEFKVDGCWQDETYFLLSSDCQKNPKECLKRGKAKKINHPGGGIGSPAFIQCYRVGGRPRFLQVKAKDKWVDTSTCFFGSEKSFMDFDTIKKKKINSSLVN